MVGPDRGGQCGDAHGRVNHGGVAEDRFAAEHRNDFGDDAEERDRDDVHLGVAEEPEQVLPQDRPAVGGVIDMRPEVPVGTAIRKVMNEKNGSSTAPVA